MLIPHLGGGGAEHVTFTLARYLNQEKYELHLGLVTQATCHDANLPSSVTIHCLGSARVRHSALRLLWLVWKVRPQIILSGMAHLNLLTLMLRPIFPVRTRVLVRHNGALPATLVIGRGSQPSQLLFGVGYRHADRVICQTRFMARDLQRALSIDSAKLVVLPNPVSIQQIRTHAARKNDGTPRHRILAVARLAPEKGIDLLLEALARLSRSLPRVALDIAGSGPCESSLRTQCKARAIEDRVRFMGGVASPAQHFSSTSLFVLPSRHEGLPNALLEAAAAGLPIVALPASPGLSQLLNNKEGVWLASEVSADALHQALDDALRAITPGQRFRHAWVDAFDLPLAISEYEHVIDQALQECRT